ncbi:MAG: GNAT family N-acetyltransferase [Mycobacteriales bacterium]
MTAAVPRDAVPADAGALSSVMRAAWRHGYPGVVPDRVLAGVDQLFDAAWFTGLLAEGGFRTVVSGDPITGFVRYGPYPDDTALGYIAALYVHPSAAGHGLGRHLLDHALAALAAAGHRTALLWVFEPNTRARQLYARAGFTPDGTTRTNPAYATPELRLHRPL